MSSRRAPYFLALLVATAATLIAPPWHYELTVTDVRPGDIRLQGFDRSEIAFAWEPPVHQHYLAAGQSGLEIRTEGREVDLSRRALWWAIITMAAFTVWAPITKGTLSFGIPVRAAILLSAALLGVLIDRTYVDTLRPRLQAWQLERGLQDEFGRP